MKKITAEEFYKGFLDCIKKGVSEGKTPWEESRKRYHNDFTGYINKELMPQYLKNFSSDFSNEYYRFDVSCWEQKKDEVESICKKVKMNSHLWDFCVAFEHENNLKDWFDEVIKLLFIDCPLKVVVGYNKYSKRFTENDLESDCSKMDALCKILGKLQRINDLLKNKVFLIILGNGGRSKKDRKYEQYTDKEYFGYKGYKLCIKGNEVSYEEIK